MRIDWAEPAVSDLQDIHEYIKKDSELYADIIVEKILGAIDNLNLLWVGLFQKPGRKIFGK